MIGDAEGFLVDLAEMPRRDQIMPAKLLNCRCAVLGLIQLRTHRYELFVMFLLPDFLCTLYLLGERLLRQMQQCGTALIFCLYIG